MVLQSHPTAIQRVNWFRKLLMDMELFHSCLVTKMTLSICESIPSFHLKAERNKGKKDQFKEPIQRFV